MNNTKVDTRKIAILVGAVVLVIIIIALVSGGKKEEVGANAQEETRILEGEKLAEVKQYGGLEISNVKFEIEDKMTEVTADVINNTGNDLERQYVNINILDQSGNKITDVGGYIGDIEAGGTGKMIGSFLTSEATSNAYNIEITEKKPNDETVNVGNEEINQ